MEKKNSKGVILLETFLGASMRTSLLIIAAIAFLALCASPAPEQERGWLAQRQIQARQNCAELIKYRMRW